MYGQIHVRLTLTEKGRPPQRVTLAHLGQHGFKGSMHPLDESVRLRMVGGGVQQLDTMKVSPRPQFSSRELQCVVTQDGVWSAKVRDVLGKFSYYTLSTFGLKRVELDKSRVMIYYCEDISVTILTIRHVCEINGNPLQWL